MNESIKYSDNLVSGIIKINDEIILDDEGLIYIKQKLDIFNNFDYYTIGYYEENHYCIIKSNSQYLVFLGIMGNMRFLKKYQDYKILTQDMFVQLLPFRKTNNDIYFNEIYSIGVIRTDDTIILDDEGLKYIDLQLKENNVNLKSYCIGDYCENTYCVVKANGKYLSFVGEKGIMKNLIIHNTYKQVVKYILSILKPNSKEKSRIRFRTINVSGIKKVGNNIVLEDSGLIYIKQKIDNFNFDESIYAIGEYKKQAICIVKHNNLYLMFYGYRGCMDDLIEFEDYQEAADILIKKLSH